MDTQTIKQLNQLNTDFYNTTAVDFDGSRQYFWEGWEKIPPLLDKFNEIRVADIGCGNGRFGQFLFEKCPQIKLSYTGIDANNSLLSKAEQTLKGKIPALHLQHQDIITSLLNNKHFLGNEVFQLIVSFGVFHHIPSLNLRTKLLKYLLNNLSKDGFIIISFWQFMNFERFQNKIITAQKQLQAVGVDSTKLEKNDYILDWNRGAHALRYCHFYDEEEQEELVKQAGAKIIKTYFADGKEGNVNQYIVITHDN